MIKYLTELLGDTDAVYADAANDPKIAAKKKPSLDNVLTAIVKVVERRAVAAAADLIRDEVQEVYDMYTITYGDRPALLGTVDITEDGNHIDTWDSGLDDAVEAVLKPYNDVLSNDWLAQNTIDVRLYEENGVEAFAQSFGKEVYKQLCWNNGKPEEGGGRAKTPAQVLASAGILTSAVIARFDDRINSGTMATEGNITVTSVEGTEAVDADAERIGDVIDRVFERVGIDYDVDEVQQEFENVLDDDDILSRGAAQRLGIGNDEDVNAIQMFGLNEGRETPRLLMSMLADRSLAAKDPAPLPDKPGRRSRAGTPPGKAMPVAVLAGLQAHASVPASTMAERIGVSRATYNNYVNGKTPFVPDEVQAVAVRAEIVKHIDGLMVALAAFDGAVL